MESLPTKISPCPIIEATIELKFSSNLPKGAVFGVLYNAIKEDFGIVEKLPTAMLPIEVMENDPNLKYKALYKLKGDIFNVQIGYDVVTFHSPVEYVGWHSFFKNIIVFFDKVKESGVISKPESLLLKYINFFEGDIYEHINLQVQLLNENHHSNNLVLRTEFREDNFIKVLQVANNVTVSGSFGQRQGSLIDITCAYDKSENLLEEFDKIIEQTHLIEKQLFFGLLKPDFLETLKPEYNNE